MLSGVRLFALFFLLSCEPCVMPRNGWTAEWVQIVRGPRLKGRESCLWRQFTAAGGQTVGVQVNPPQQIPVLSHVVRNQVGQVPLPVHLQRALKPEEVAARAAARVARIERSNPQLGRTTQGS